ncbi:MAG: DegT/DnrJ/EryC1/StrS family aminotransferase, partial [Firmicutes bacterium]|nr:DegT/DnrJ/EryC1/StrS family aminotransferase [Bacillota bacterium]
CAQLEKIDFFCEKRRENFEYLHKGLQSLKDKLILPQRTEKSNTSWFGYIITCKEQIERNKIVQHLENQNIQTRMLFAGNLTKHPCFDEMRKSGEGYRIVHDLVNTDRIMQDSFWIGVYPGMSKDMLDYMIEKIKEAVK